MDKFTSEESKNMLVHTGNQIVKGLPVENGLRWHCSLENNMVSLIGYAGDTAHPMEILMHYDSSFNPKRITFYGCMPKIPNGHGQTYTFGYYDEFKKLHNNSITVAWDKAPAKIAKDIERRLLPGYTALYNEASKRVNAQESQRLDKNARIGKVCELLGVQVRDDWMKDGSYPEVGRYQDKIDVKVNHSDYELKIDGIKNIETLEMIVDFVKRNRNCQNEIEVQE